VYTHVASFIIHHTKENLHQPKPLYIPNNDLYVVLGFGHSQRVSLG